MNRLAISAVLIAAAVVQVAAASMADVRRGVLAAGSKTSQQPALRQARESGEPSDGFKLGVALGAWSNATDQLSYDLKIPSGDGDDIAAIDLDCQEERVAFSDLQTYRQAAGLEMSALAGAGRPEDADLTARLTARANGPVARCR